MSTLFRGGPANDVSLSLNRAPRFLRVVRAPALGRKAPVWDALDQLHDAPDDNEEIFVYEIEGEPMRAFVRPGGLKIIAYYRWVGEVEDAAIRETEAWRSWTTARANAERIDRPAPSGPNLPP